MLGGNSLKKEVCKLNLIRPIWLAKQDIGYFPLEAGVEEGNTSNRFLHMEGNMGKNPDYWQPEGREKNFVNWCLLVSLW